MKVNLVKLTMVGLIFAVVFFIFYINQSTPLPPIEEQNLVTIDESMIENIGYGVAVDNPLAMEIGLDVLSNGGNAVDASIAVSYALGVLEPYGSGIGGGGIALIYPPNKEPIVYDYRETAPLSGKNTRGSVGVPGFVKGMETLHQDFGTITLEELIQPSIALAEDGFKVSKTLHNRLSVASYRINIGDIPHFFPNKAPIPSGRIMKQPDLAKTLKTIQHEGSATFYEGSIRDYIVKKIYGITDDDLHTYQVIKSKPLQGKFAGYDVLVPPPPSGGVMLLQSLQMAEHLSVEKTVEGELDYIKLMGQINRRTNVERLNQIGDPSFVSVPVDDLISMDYTKKLASEISLDQFSNKYLTELDTVSDFEDDGNTTHFVIVDKDGMMVSTTNTLSNFFGSGINVGGFFLNNQLDNFSMNSQSPNAIASGKRPFSHITPTIFAFNGKPVIGIGSAGGTRIITALSQVLVKSLKFNQSIENAVKDYRFYMNVSDNTIALEGPVNRMLEQQLRQSGYQIDQSQPPIYFGGVQCLIIDY